RRVKYQADYSSLKKIEERKHENPNQIDEVPEKAGHFHTIRQMFWVVTIDAGAGRKHHITKNEDTAEDVRAVQAGYGKIAREVRTVFRQKHGGIFHIAFFNGGDFVGGWHRPKMRPIHRGISRIGIDRVERDLVLFNIRIL